MKDAAYFAHVKTQIVAYRTALRCDGISVAYSGNKSVDEKTTQAIRLVDQARMLLDLAIEELA